MVSGIVYVFMRFVVRDWSEAAGFTNYGGYWSIDNHTQFNYLSDVTEN